TAFYAAVAEGHLEVVKYLVKRNGEVPLHYNGMYFGEIAVSFQRYEMALYLWKEEVIEAHDNENEGFWPILYVGRAEVFEPNFMDNLIAQNLWGVDEVSDLGNTMLHVACRTGHRSLLDICLDNGANIDIKNNNGQTPLE
ncbi:unnamed protein product, partial [Ectocarpus sp. 4 AP-2014]